MKIQNCKVRDFGLDFLSWTKDGKIPTHKIYLCCRVESGNKDYIKSTILSYRPNWINNGVLWFNTI